MFPELLHSLGSRGVAGRFDIWQNWCAAWSVDTVKMVFGYGLGSSTNNMVGSYSVAHFHSLYLSTLFYGGVIGSILVVGWLLMWPVPFIQVI